MNSVRYLIDIKMNKIWAGRMVGDKVALFVKDLAHNKLWNPIQQLTDNTHWLPFRRVPF